MTYESATNPRWRQNGAPGMTIAEREEYLEGKCEVRIAFHRARCEMLARQVVEAAAETLAEWEEVRVSKDRNADTFPLLFGGALGKLEVLASRAKYLLQDSAHLDEELAQ